MLKEALRCKDSLKPCKGSDKVHQEQFYKFFFSLTLQSVLNEPTFFRKIMPQYSGECNLAKLNSVGKVLSPMAIGKVYAKIIF